MDKFRAGERCMCSGPAIAHRIKERGKRDTLCTGRVHCCDPDQLLALTLVILVSLGPRFLFWKMRDLGQADCKPPLHMVFWT